MSNQHGTVWTKPQISESGTEAGHVSPSKGYYYDFHLHSCLSPCGDNDMTPNNIVGMASLLGLQIIALTDHNSVKNCRAVCKVGRQNGLVVIPGMELCTSEEIHVVTLFPDVDSAEAFGAHVSTTLPPIPNRPDIFGEQRILDENDEIVGLEEVYLLSASSISIEEVMPLCGFYGGVCYPAHIDRSSFSVISALGLFPDHIGFRFAELSRQAGPGYASQVQLPQGLKLLRSSDAHYLEDIDEAKYTLPLENCTPAAAVKYLESAPLA